jgi:hypothetical protein
MSEARTVTRHMLRRTARDKRSELSRLQAQATRKGGVREAAEAAEAERELERYGITWRDRLRVRSSVRGPFGWKVVAL